MESLKQVIKQYKTYIDKNDEPTAVGHSVIFFVGMMAAVGIIFYFLSSYPLY